MHGIFFNEPIDNNFLGHQMAEVYKDGIYNPFLHGRKDLTILDIGANIGVTSYYFSQFAKTVYSLEPSLQHFDILTRMLTFNKIDNVKPINKALYIENGKLPLFHNDNKTMFSLHQAVAKETQDKELVDCITFDKLLEDNKIKKVDFLKLDIEGSEPEIFGHTSFRESADKIDTMMFETHTWSGRHPNQILDSLTSLGFAVTQIPNDASVFVAKR